MNSIPDDDKQRLWLSSAVLLMAFGSTVLFWDEGFESATRINSFVVGANSVTLGAIIWFYRLSLGVPYSAWTMYSSAFVLIAAGFSSLWWPNSSKDVDEWRGLMIMAGTAGGLFALACTRPREDGTMAVREKTALCGLISTLFIGNYVFDKFQELGWYRGVGDASAGKVIVAVIVMFIFQSIVIHIIESREGIEVLTDERDAAIERRADGIANTALQVLLIGAIIAMGVFPRGWAGWESSVATAHALIGALILADIVAHATTLWLYRFARS